MALGPIGDICTDGRQYRCRHPNLKRKTTIMTDTVLECLLINGAGFIPAN